MIPFLVSKVPRSQAKRRKKRKVKQVSKKVQQAEKNQNADRDEAVGSEREMDDEDDVFEKRKSFEMENDNTRSHNRLQLQVTTSLWELYCLPTYVCITVPAAS